MDPNNYQLRLEHPIFQAQREMINRNTAKKSFAAMGPVQARVKLGGAEGLREAVESGEVVAAKTSQGKPCYIFSSELREKSVEKQDWQRLMSTRALTNQEDLDAVQKTFDCDVMGDWEEQSSGRVRSRMAQLEDQADQDLDYEEVYTDLNTQYLKMEKD